VSKVFKGNTVANSVLSCDSVMAGAFFPQPDPQVPQEKVSEHAREHVVIPSRIFPHLIVIHPELTFCFLKALLDGPPDAAQPDKDLEPRAHRGIADVV
jgi:hypothetical protein